MKTNAKQITMSLNQIRAFNPCKNGWEKLLKAQGKTQPDDVQIPLKDILKSNGVEDVIWCMRVNWFEHKEIYMKFVSNCVKRARQHAAAANAASYAAVFYAYANAVAKAAYAAERKTQYKSLMALLQ